MDAYEDLKQVNFSRPSSKMATAYATHGFKSMASIAHSRTQSDTFGKMNKPNSIYTAKPLVNIAHVDNLNAYAKDAQGLGGENKFRLKAFLSSRKSEHCMQKRAIYMEHRKQKAINELDRHQKNKIRVSCFNPSEP